MTHKQFLYVVYYSLHYKIIDLYPVLVSLQNEAQALGQLYEVALDHTTNARIASTSNIGYAITKFPLIKGCALFLLRSFRQSNKYQNWK